MSLNFMRINYLSLLSGMLVLLGEEVQSNIAQTGLGQYLFFFKPGNIQ